MTSAVSKILGVKKPKATTPAAVEPLPPAPERSDAETEALAEEQRRAFAGGAGGRASTYFTASGTSAASSAVRYLGGAART